MSSSSRLTSCSKKLLKASRQWFSRSGSRPWWFICRWLRAWAIWLILKARELSSQTLKNINSNSYWVTFQNLRVARLVFRLWNSDWRNMADICSKMMAEWHLSTTEKIRISGSKCPIIPQSSTRQLSGPSKRTSWKLIFGANSTFWRLKLKNLFRQRLWKRSKNQLS